MDTISEYFNDILEAYYNKKLTVKLENNRFKFSPHGIDYTRYVVLKSEEEYYTNRIVICLYEKASDCTFIGKTSEIPMYFVVDANEISYSLNEYTSEYYKHELVQLDSETDLFNLRLQYDFNIEYKHLLFLQTHVQLKVNGLVQLFYSRGEEKYYGYE